MDPIETVIDVKFLVCEDETIGEKMKILVKAIEEEPQLNVTRINLGFEISRYVYAKNP